MKSYIIGVDIGTGSTKAVALTMQNEVVAVAQSHYTMLNKQPGYAEQDVEEIWTAFTICIKKIIATLPNRPAAVSLSSCMHSLVVIDKNNNAVTNLITWADTRSEEIAEELRTSSGAEEIYRLTGTPIHSMSPLCKIIWLKKNESEIFDRAHKFIGIKEYIWHKLFNVYQVDQSVASASGLFNLETSQWNQASLDLCGIVASQLSEIVSTSFIRNTPDAAISSALQIASDTPFCIGAGDGCLANIGSQAITKNVAALTIGTSGAVRIASPSPVFNYRAMTFNYVLDEETFICGGPLNNGGNVVQWILHRFLNTGHTGANGYTELFEMVDSIAPGSNGLLFLPFLNGERAPVWDERACGVFFGVKSHHTNSHFVRAALEGVCYALNTVLQIIETSTAPVMQLNTSGGFVQSTSWMKMLSDVTGKKICLVQTEDASSIGAALLCMKAMKHIESYSSVASSNNLIIEPVPGNHDLYNRYYDIFKNLYPSLKDAMHRLHTIT